MNTLAAQLAEVLSRQFALTAFVCDRDRILAVSGSGRRELTDRSISMAATTFVGQNYGAGRLDRVKRSVWVTLATVSYTHLVRGAVPDTAPRRRQWKPHCSQR